MTLEGNDGRTIGGITLSKLSNYYIVISDRTIYILTFNNNSKKLTFLIK